MMMMLDYVNLLVEFVIMSVSILSQKDNYYTFILSSYVFIGGGCHWYIYINININIFDLLLLFLVSIQTNSNFLSTPSLLPYYNHPHHALYIEYIFIYKNHESFNTPILSTLRTHLLTTHATSIPWLQILSRDVNLYYYYYFVL